MKISTNNVGNYGPRYIPDIKNIKRTAEVQPEQFAEKITNDEKQFFTEMYPQSKNEITDYHFYQKSGKMSGVSLGSLFDKRG